jgi:hypothetical protein
MSPFSYAHRRVRWLLTQEVPVGSDSEVQDDVQDHVQDEVQDEELSVETDDPTLAVSPSGGDTMRLELGLRVKGYGLRVRG